MKKLFIIFLIPLVSCITINKYYPTKEIITVKTEECKRNHLDLNSTVKLPARIQPVNKGAETCAACKHMGCLVNGCTYNPKHTCELFKFPHYSLQVQNYFSENTFSINDTICPGCLHKGTSCAVYHPNGGCDWNTHTCKKYKN